MQDSIEVLFLQNMVLVGTMSCMLCGQTGLSQYIKADVNTSSFSPPTTHNDSKAILADGSVVVFGDQNGGGDNAKLSAAISSPQAGAGVVVIASSNKAFCALLESAKVACWGSGQNGVTKPPSSIAATTTSSSSSKVKALYGNYGSFVAILEGEGEEGLVAWGSQNYGGTGAPTRLSSKAVAMASTKTSWAALLDDGTACVCVCACVYVCGGGSVCVCGCVSSPPSSPEEMISRKQRFLLSSNFDRWVMSHFFFPLVFFVSFFVSLFLSF